MKSTTAMVEKHHRVIALLLSAVYFLLAAQAARTRMLWGDELYTLYVARLGDWLEINRLLATGAEFHPPFFYRLESACIAVFGESELALRLPSIAGFWLMPACLFVYLRGRTTVAASLAGAIFPGLAASSYFAIEARGYALMMGFASVALLCWDRAGESRRRRGLALAGFALALAAAAASSYYAILLAIPFAIAQAVRWHRTRRLEPGTWCALIAVLLPMMFSGRLARPGMQVVSSWPAPPWSVAVGFYADLVQPAAIPLVCFGVIALVRWLLRPQLKSQAPQAPAAIGDVTVAVALLAFSIWVMLAARIATHAFALRYAIPSVIGASLLIGFAATRASRFVQMALLTIFVIFAIAGGMRAMERGRQERAQWDAGVRWLVERQPKSPLVIDGVGTFLKLSNYGPPEIRSRIVMLTDPARALKYDVNSSDDTLRLLNPWFHLPLDGYDEFIRRHDAFLVLSDHWTDWAAWQWVTRALVDDGLQVTVMDQHAKWILYRVTRSPSSRNQRTVDSIPRS